MHLLNKQVLGRVGVFILLIMILTATAVFADGWRANDDGNDDPDGLNKWFAAHSTTHNMAWWDNDGVGRADYVAEWNMEWRYPASTWLPDHALAQQLYTGRKYEATDYIWTDLPNINHNEDSSESEELRDGYEEKEVGTTLPETIVPYQRYSLWTEYVPDGYWSDWNTYFTSFSELNKRWASYKCFAQPDWCPVDTDKLGHMNVTDIQ